LNAPNLHVPGEYVVLLLPSVDEFWKRIQADSYILEIRALCMLNSQLLALQIVFCIHSAMTRLVSQVFASFHATPFE
jgi:hypothetical protein